jgi:signal transduction histidine kinase
LLKDLAGDELQALQQLGAQTRPHLQFDALDSARLAELAPALTATYDAVVVACGAAGKDCGAPLAELIASGYRGLLVAVGPDDEACATTMRALGVADYLVHTPSYWRYLPYAVKSTLLERRVDDINAFKDQFISVASHELKNPLAALRGYAELLLRRIQREQADERSLRGLDIIIQQSLRMQQILDDLHDLARLNRGQIDLALSQVSIGSLVQRAVATLNAEHDTPAVELPTLDPTLTITGDLEHLAQALTRVMALLSTHGAANTPLQIRVASRGNERSEVEIEVRGQSGLMAGDLSDAFAHFYSGNKASPITATERLSLYVCAQLIALHRGQIRFDNTPDGESVFLINLPLAS